MPRIKLSALSRDLLLRGVWEGLGTPECLVTGGYVRDRLLGRNTVDLDLVLPGTLENARGPARRLAARLDGSAHVLGRDDKRVWRIETPRLKVELWPLGDLDLERDIHRRDFSFNALMWRLPDGPLIDRVDGAADLRAGILRAIRKKNLQEDPVRLIRAARFLAQFPAFGIDGRTADWIRSLAPKVRRAPPERLGQELLKLVTLPNRRRGFEALLDLGILGRTVRPEAGFDGSWITANLDAVARLQPNAHPLRAALGEAGDSAALAALLRTWSSPHPDAVAHYAWPRMLRLHAANAARMLDSALTAVDGPAADRRALIHRAGSAFPAVIAFAAAVEPGHNWNRWWRQWHKHGADLVDPAPLLAGEEIAALLGLPPGPALGRAVAALTEARVRDEVRTRRGAERWLQRWFEAQSPRLWPKG
jgi:tRNA nucleotidyltransferase/poly(A) polymerase